ncbi:hypothetical protein Rhopal_003029-T1 [Rhodotorula paludigena]|uniref:Restriction of telomere capping protein 4 n=1 Tax=Rhodotorula paludigena TaxID=86838 RepID=A0AAV5GKP0_9BASI|nr:hypothetical protein Rhopal_003029-T1 [Rhodotorula paludigena]
MGNLHGPKGPYDERTRPSPLRAGIPFSVPAANGQSESDRSPLSYGNTGYQPSAVASSSFHGGGGGAGGGAYGQSSSGGRQLKKRDRDGGPRYGPHSTSQQQYGPGGDGFNSGPRNSVLGFLDDHDYSYQHPPAPGQNPFKADALKCARKGKQRAPHSPTRTSPRRLPIDALDLTESPTKAGERERKAAFEAGTAKQQTLAASTELEKQRLAGIKAARREGAAAAAKKSASKSSSSKQTLLDKLADADKDGLSKSRSKKDEGVASSSLKAKQQDKGDDKARDRRSSSKVKGKDKASFKAPRRRVEYESDIDNSSPAKPSSSAPARKGKLGTFRGGFDYEEPSSSARASTSQSKRKKGKKVIPPSSDVEDDEPAEQMPTLAEMMALDAEEDDTAEQRRREKGKGRAVEADDDEYDEDLFDEQRLLAEERAERLRDEESPDPLLDDRDESVDPDTLCPFCDASLPDKPSRELLALKQSLLRQPHDIRPTLRNARAVRFVDQHVVRTSAFCKRHNEERTIIPEGIKRGWPRTIAWDQLPKRIDRQIAPHLTKIIFGQQKSSFFERAKAKWAELGGRRGNVIDDYGPRGLEIIQSTLHELFTRTQPILTAPRVAPLSVDWYLRRVLSPECAVELLRHDLARNSGDGGGGAGGDRAEAEQLRAESRAYGRAMFPVEDDEVLRVVKAEEQDEERRVEERLKRIEERGRELEHGDDEGAPPKKRRKERERGEDPPAAEPAKSGAGRRKPKALMGAPASSAASTAPAAKPHSNGSFSSTSASSAASAGRASDKPSTASRSSKATTSTTLTVPDAGPSSAASESDSDAVVFSHPAKSTHRASDKARKSTLGDAPRLADSTNGPRRVQASSSMVLSDDDDDDDGASSSGAEVTVITSSPQRQRGRAKRAASSSPPYPSTAQRPSPQKKDQKSRDVAGSPRASKKRPSAATSRPSAAPVVPKKLRLATASDDDDEAFLAEVPPVGFADRSRAKRARDEAERKKRAKEARSKAGKKAARERGLGGGGGKKRGARSVDESSSSESD